MPAIETISSLRQSIQRIDDANLKSEIMYRVDELQHVALAMKEQLDEQQGRIEELAVLAGPPNTLAAISPALCYDPAA